MRVRNRAQALQPAELGGCPRIERKRQEGGRRVQQTAQQGLLCSVRARLASDLVRAARLTFFARRYAKTQIEMLGSPSEMKCCDDPLDSAEMGELLEEFCHSGERGRAARDACVEVARAAASGFSLGTFL